MDDRIKQFRVGDRVRVRGHKGTAIIVQVHDEIKGAIRLDREIGGFHWWNVWDLHDKKVPGRKSKVRLSAKRDSPGRKRGRKPARSRQKKSKGNSGISDK